MLQLAVDGWVVQKLLKLEREIGTLTPSILVLILSIVVLTLSIVVLILQLIGDLAVDGRFRSW